MTERYPLAIIGAGPAGLAAAALAAGQGLELALFDEQLAPGGQIYRGIESVPEGRAAVLGGEYDRGLALVEAMRARGIRYFPECRVWSLEPGPDGLALGLEQRGQARVVQAERVLLANGAMERPLPFPGWTLPGVMNAGAGQILLKAEGLVPEDGVVIAGCGPLLWLLAWQYLRCGVQVQAILDMAPPSNRLRALPRLPRALLTHHYIAKGLGYERDLKRAGVPILRGVQGLRALGGERLEAVGFRRGRQQRQLECGLLLVHFGLVPNTHLSRAAGCNHGWDRAQQCWRPRSDQWGRSSVEGLLLAGDGAGIFGARSAEHAGRLAACEALHSLGLVKRAERDRLAAADRRWLRADRHVRPFLESLFRLPERLLQVADDDTIVCRCEEVSAGQIRAAAADGHLDSNQVKFLTRCGMGPCQGRQCADAVAQVLAAELGLPVSEAGHYRVRPPAKPLSLGQLAALYPEATE